MTTSRLADKYAEIRKQLLADGRYKNYLAIPRIEKIVLNVGFGKISAEEKQVEAIVSDLERITGQKAVKTRAKLDVAGFKVRKGQVVGAMVTLNGPRMYEFLDRLISMTLPRIRDFRGLSRTAFSGGSYSIGIREHTSFPEISVLGKNAVPMQVVIVMNTKDADKAREVLAHLGMPFKKEEE